MPSFSDVYLIPLVGNLVHSYLSPKDDAEISNVSEEYTEFHEEYIYPMRREIDLDTLGEDPLPYLSKVSPYVESITCMRNPSCVALPSVRTLPKLRTLTYAVPLVLDTTLRRIHPATHQYWAKVNDFLQSLFTVDNCVESVRIIPGPVHLVRTNPDSDDYVEEHILEDTTEGSHLQLYRKYGMPVVLNVYRPRTMFFGDDLRELHVPMRMASLAMQNWCADAPGCTGWDAQATGIASVILDLAD